MSLFPRAIISEAEPTNSSYHPIFRFFDEFDQYSRAPERASRQTFDNHSQGSPFSFLKQNVVFTPKFDVKEIKDGYELHGEFPGINQKDIEIEFTDSNTLTIKGRSERNYTSDAETTTTESGEGKGKITEKKDEHDLKAKVEDEETATSSEITSTHSNSNAMNKTEVGKHHDRPKQPEEKYWVSERSVGEFSRSFSFPVRVDQDAVRASMKNGVLTVLVPKAKKQESRRISIK